MTYDRAPDHVAPQNTKGDRMIAFCWVAFDALPQGFEGSNPPMTAGVRAR